MKRLPSIRYCVDDLHRFELKGETWIGERVRRQRDAEDVLPGFLRRPVQRKFLIYEPYDPLDLSAVRYQDGSVLFVGASGGDEWAGAPRKAIRWLLIDLCDPKEGPVDLANVRRVVRQCREAEIPLYIRGLGKRVVNSDPSIGPWPVDPDTTIRFRSQWGVKTMEWPEDLQGAREWPR